MTNATIVKRKELTGHVTELIVMPDEPVSYVAGQWVSLALPTGPNPPLKRAYSMATAPRDDGTLVLTFDHVPNGVGSGYLATLNEEDRLQMSDGAGTFTLPEDLDHARPICFAAHYTGIVPVRGLIESVKRKGIRAPLHVLYSAPPGEESVYYDDIRSFLTPADTMSVWNGDPSKDWLSEKWGTELTRQLLALASKNALYFVAGVGRFVRPLRAILKGEGVTRDRVRAQRYD